MVHFHHSCRPFFCFQKTIPLHPACLKPNNTIPHFSTKLVGTKAQLRTTLRDVYISNVRKLWHIWSVYVCDLPHSSNGHIDSMTCTMPQHTSSNPARPKELYQTVLISGKKSKLCVKGARARGGWRCRLLRPVAFRPVWVAKLSVGQVFDIQS